MHAHDVVGLQDFILAIEKPDGRTVSFPPDSVRCIRLFAHEDLSGNDAPLMVDTHKNTENEVEGDPGACPNAKSEPGFRKLKGRKD